MHVSMSEIIGNFILIAGSFLLLIFLVKPVSTLPGPTSTNRVTPKLTISATQSSHNTGFAACVTKDSLISFALVKILPVTFATTGI